MKISEIYSYYFANWVSRGNLFPKGSLSHLSIKTAYDKILTKNFERKTYIITGMNTELEVNVTEVLRRILKSTYPNVEVIIHTINLPININVNNDIYTKQMASAYEEYDKTYRLLNSLADNEKLTGKLLKLSNGIKRNINKTTVENAKKKYYSYAYTSQYKNSGGEFTHTVFAIEVLFPDRKIITRYEKTLASLVNQCKCSIKPIRGNTNDFLLNYGIASQFKEHLKGANLLMMSDENLSYSTCYRTSGLVGGRGILFGQDINSKLPLLINLTNSGQAQVILLTGISGSGKTYAAYQIADSLLDFNIHVGVRDLKGSEWSRLGKYHKHIIIDFSGESPCFVNTFRLDDLVGLVNNPSVIFDLGLDATVDLLTIVVNLQKDEGNETDLKDMLRDAVMKYYNACEVDKDISDTFVNSRNMKYYELMPIIATLRTSDSYTAKQKEMCLIAYNRLYAFFKPNSRYSKAFQNEVSLADIINTPLVIYSFNKNENQSVDNLDNLRIFMSHYLDNKKHMVRKKKKLHTASFEEEVQRSKEYAKMMVAMAHKVTGSRSSNVMVFLLTNSMSVFKEPELMSVASNITSVIAGKLNEDDIKILVKNFKCKSIEKDLYKISESVGHKFAIRYDTGKEINNTVYRVLFPEHKEKQFETRDKQDCYSIK